MVGPAAGGAGRVIKAGILLIAHDRVSKVFRTVGTSAFRLTKILGKLNVVVFALSLAWKPLTKLVNKFTVALAGLAAGIAVAQWVSYQQVLRRARFTLVTAGLTAEEVSSSFRRLGANVSRATEIGILRHIEAVQELARTDADTIIQAALLTEKIVDLGTAGDDAGPIFAAIVQAISGIDDQPLKDLATQLGIIGAEVQTSTSLIKVMQDALEEDGPATNTTRLAGEVGKLRDMWAPDWMGRVGDFIVAMPLAFITTVRVISDLILGIAKVAKAFLELLGIFSLMVDALKAIWALLGLIRKGWGFILAAITNGLATLEKSLIDFRKAIVDWVEAWTKSLGLAIRDAIDFAIGAWGRFFTRIRDGTFDIGEFFQGVWDGVVRGFKTILNEMIDMLNRWIGRLNSVIDLANILNPFQDIPKLDLVAPIMHRGGVVPGPAGADVPIIAQAGERIIPNGGGGIIVVQLVMDRNVFGEVVVDVINRTAKFKAGMTPSSVATA